tara:strand:- start:120 stop:1511 length:1392 start_codon:yes stop_codon:yes gene_type:complete
MMRRDMLLTTRLDQRLVMNQTLKQVIKFLQYTTLELKQQVKEVLETNPLIDVAEDSPELESEEDDAWLPGADYTGISRHGQSSAQEDYIQNIAEQPTLRKHLIDQTLNCHFNHHEQQLAEAIIDSIDEDGFLTISVDELIEVLSSDEENDHHYDVDQFMKVLNLIQGFDPIGIACISLKESLLNQLHAKSDGSEGYFYAEKIVSVDALGLSPCDVKNITKKTGLTSDQLTIGFNTIKTLDFHPAKSFSNNQQLINDPEVYAKKVNNKWQAYLNESILTRLNINPLYTSMIKTNRKDVKFKTVLTQLQEAKQILSAIERRNTTLMAVANYIVEAQQDFFENGNQDIRSINLAEVADALGFHESTISRITTGKYISTPHGVFELKYFFPSHVTTTVGDNKSSISVKTVIKEIIDSESPQATHSDEAIADILKARGINISRRTVAKYRESMNIPTSYLRVGINQLK